MRDSGHTSCETAEPQLPRHHHRSRSRLDIEEVNVQYWRAVIRIHTMKKKDLAPVRGILDHKPRTEGVGVASAVSILSLVVLSFVPSFALVLVQ